MPNAHHKICQVPLKMPGGLQIVVCQENKHWVPTKMPGAHQNATCPPKEGLGPYQDARAPENKCWVPTKTPGGSQNTRCPQKETLGAHEDAGWPTKCHMHNKRNAACPHGCQVATKMPRVLQIKAGCLSRGQVGTRTPGHHQNEG